MNNYYKKEKMMAKRFIVWVGIFVSIGFVARYVIPQEPQKFKYELTQEETDMVLYGLDKSDLPHDKVLALQQNILNQFTKQVPPQKQIADSLNKKKNQ